MSRYNQILNIIAHIKPRTIVEVGTWNGLRAIMMATEALKHQESVHYIGFDLFEDANEETDKRELNVKEHHSVQDVWHRLLCFQQDHPGFTARLIKGDTRGTLFTPHSADPLTDVSNVDLAFIDGGHSIETIRNDYEALKNAKVIVFDDFYTGRDISKHGCNQLLEELAKEGKRVAVLPQADPVKGGGKVQMAVTPTEAWPGKQDIFIKTKNCVPDEEIQANIKHSLTKITRWVRECKPHQQTAVLVSGGPSLDKFMDKIKEEKSRIICVKHAHDKLIENGIIPWACMLLDPRSHVQDFIENPHPFVTYFCASMCHPTTVDRLVERDAMIWGYHAHVGAKEETVLPQGSIMIGGGSTSAVRGISVLHTLGFRKFRLYAYDSCYWEKPDFSERTKTGQPKYLKVNVSGRDFWSDAELLAQAQDFNKLIQQPQDIDIEVIGDGMIPHVWQVGRKILPEFKDLVNG